MNDEKFILSHDRLQISLDAIVWCVFGKYTAKNIDTVIIIAKR